MLNRGKERGDYMARIKINDLPENRAISKKEARIVLGGNMAIPDVCQTPSGAATPFPFIGNVPSSGGGSSTGSSTNNGIPNSSGDDPGLSGGKDVTTQPALNYTFDLKV